jgi:type I restriction enzyme, S subunit
MGMNEERKAPEGWVIKKLGEVCEINPKIPNKETIPDDFEVQFLPMKLVEEIVNRFHLTETRKYGEVKKGYTPFINDDVIFAKVTPCMENGKIAVVNKLKNNIGFGSSEFHVIRATKTILSRYLFYFVVQNIFRHEAAKEMTGAVGLRRVPKQFLENYLIPLPPLPEQKAIVAKIEELLSDLENGKQQLLSAQEQLKVYRQSLLKAAFEGRLTNKDVKEGELPDGWKIDVSRNIFSYVTSGSRGWAKYYADHGAIFLRMGNLDHDSITLDLSDIQNVILPNMAEGKRSIVNEGDILISITADVGMIALIPKEFPEAYINQHIALARPTRDIVYSPYLAWFLSSKENGQKQFRNLQRGATKVGLGLDDIKAVQVPLPSIEEQRLIVSLLESRLTVCDHLSQTISQSLSQAETLRQSILKKAFEGKLIRLNGDSCDLNDEHDLKNKPCIKNEVAV